MQQSPELITKKGETDQTQCQQIKIDTVYAPFMDNIEAYKEFLINVHKQYQFITKECA